MNVQTIYSSVKCECYIKKEKKESKRSVNAQTIVVWTLKKRNKNKRKNKNEWNNQKQCDCTNNNFFLYLSVVVHN